MQALIGVVVFAAGLGGMLRLVPALVNLTYPLMWWGLLMVVDQWNYRRRALSLWRPDPARFFAVIVPASALLWIGFELLNLPAPEWTYIGGFQGIAAQTVLGCASFATVIPIVVEAWWLVRGEVCVTTPLLRAARRRRGLFLIAGAVTIALPWLNHIWWLNQVMWLSPALLLLPFVKSKACEDGPRWILHLAAAGLLSGFFWECLNYPSPAHWRYEILRGAPHLFQMPLPGYIGFIPFALTCLVVYEALHRIPARLPAAALLYVVAFGSMFAVTRIYYDRGIWRP